MVNATVDEQDSKFPVAIVGMACRFPGGADNLDLFWKMLKDGRDGIEDIPADRWNINDYYSSDVKAPGKMVTKRAGFTGEIDKFDAGFFGISPREAKALDPQHRKLLEVTYEAFEDAGINIDHLHGSRTGVFVGMGMPDYQCMQTHDAEYINQYVHTGTAHSTAANRLSWTFGFTGPSLAVDTACASALTAMHIALLSMWNGEIDFAVVDAANILLIPEVTVGFSALSVLAHDGKLRAYDAGASGYVRGEGFGAVLFKPLHKALEDGNHIYGTICGSAFNHNGRNESITMPSSKAQAELFRYVCDKYKTDPARVLHVEGHGTGTAVGDPIELSAISEVFAKAQGREIPVRVGSVKSNIGHLEIAAGIAGLIKTMLMAERKAFVPTVHFTALNPKVDSDRLVVQGRTEPSDFNEDNGLFGVNAFGFGGANSTCIIRSSDNKHLLIHDTEESKKFGYAGWTFAPESLATSGDADESKFFVFPLSARSSAGLKAVAQQYTQFSDGVDAKVAAKFLALRRPLHTANRVCVIAGSYKDFRTKLDAFIEGNAATGVVVSQAAAKLQENIGFVFSGQGPQHPLMGRVLYQTEPVFKATIDELDSLFAGFAGYSFVQTSKLFVGEVPNESIFADPKVTQPGLIFLQIALYELWKTWGVTPTIIVGHSLGELPAAYAAGILSKRDVVKIIYARSKWQATIPAGIGGMCAVGCDTETATEIINNAGLSDKVWIAAVNGPNSVTLAGDLEPLSTTIFQKCKDAGFFTQMLRVTHAFHTPHCAPMKAGFLEDTKDITPAQGKVPMVSTVTGELVGTAILNNEYWWKNVSQPVLFSTAAASLETCQVIVEIAAHPVLAPNLKQIFAQAKSEPTVIHSLSRRIPERMAILSAFSQLYVAGVAVSFAGLYAHTPSTHVNLPLYPWQREVHWQEPDNMRDKRLGLADKSLSAHGGVLSLSKYPYFLDHVAQRHLIFPGVGYVEFALEQCCKGFTVVTLENLKFMKALFWPEDTRKVHLKLVKEHANFHVYSVEEKGDVLHMSGRVGETHIVDSLPKIDIAPILERCTTTYDQKETYANFEDLAFSYGPSFQPIKRIHVANSEAIAELHYPPDDSQMFHIVLFDACLQITLTMNATGTDTYLPVYIGSLRIYHKLTRSALQARGKIYAYCRLTEFKTLLTMKGNVTLLAEDGTILAELYDFAGQNITGSSGVDLSTCVFKNEWQPKHISLPTPNKYEDLLTSFRGETVQEELAQIENVEKNLPLLQVALSKYMQHSLDQVDAGVVTVAPKNEKYVARLRELAALNVEAVKQTKEDALTIINKLTKEIPYWKIELNIIKQIGQALPSILGNPNEAIQILYGREGLGEFFSSSLTMQYYYKATAVAIKKIVDVLLAKDPSRVVRIAELGARMGAMTAHILPLLEELGNNRQLEYTFADLQQETFVYAHDRLATYTFVNYQQIDLEKDPLAQGFTAASFDIVIALNTLHATAKMDDALRCVNTLLVPDGWLYLMDPTNITAVGGDLIFGPLEIWWAFNDPIRTNHCCLTRPRWLEVLAEYGFNGFIDVSSPNEFVNSVFLCQKQKSLTVPPVSSVAANWIVFGHENDSIGSTFAQKLKKEGFAGQVQYVKATPALDVASVTSLLQDLTAKGKVGVLYCYALDVTEVTAAQDVAWYLASFIKLLHQIDVAASVSIWVVTKGAQKETTNPLQSLCTGVGRNQIHEMADLFMQMVDFDVASNNEEIVEQLSKVIQSYYGNENEFAFRNGICYDLRVVSTPYTKMKQEGYHTPDVSTTNFIAEANSTETIFKELDSERIKPGNVRVKIEYTGFNFKDLMASLNMLDDLETYTKSPYHQGAEFSGTIKEIDAGVTAFKVGDKVCGIAVHGGAFASEIMVDALHVTKVPHNLSMASAASFPISYCTAYHCLVTLANIQEGETVLIHSAAGGLGQAAIHIAKLKGAKIIATAGSPDRRQYLVEKLGVEHVSDSHSLSFVDDVNKWTNNQGVDVVLNSLTGDSLRASVKLLGFGGRFVEVGKVDILNNGKLGLLSLLENKSFISAHIDLLALNTPQKFAKLLSQIVSLFEKETLKIVEPKVYPISELNEVIKFAQTNKNFGKVVLQNPVSFFPEKFTPSSVIYRADGAYIITGGYGGLGISMALGMAERGAKHIFLVGRSASASIVVKTQLTIETINSYGCSVEYISADIAKFEDAKKVFSVIAKKNLKVRGICHFAMVIDDNLLAKMSEEQFRRVLQPKVVGGWNLHELTKDNRDLDFFISSSSVCGVQGNPEQVNYDSACTFLDALALHRKNLGLPALTIQLGAIRGTGFLDRNKVAAKITKMHGLESLHVCEDVEMLNNFIRNKEQGLILFAKQNWKAIVTLEKKHYLKNRHLMVYNVKGDGGGALTKYTPEERLEMSLKQISAMLGVSVDQIDVNNSLMAYGVDSLMSIELVNWFQKSFGVSFTQLDIFSDASLAQLMQKIK